MNDEQVKAELIRMLQEGEIGCTGVSDITPCACNGTGVRPNAWAILPHCKENCRDCEGTGFPYVLLWYGGTSRYKRLLDVEIKVRIPCPPEDNSSDDCCEARYLRTE